MKGDESANILAKVHAWEAFCVTDILINCVTHISVYRALQLYGDIMLASHCMRNTNILRPENNRNILETSVVEFATKRVDISREPVQVKLILTQIQGKNSMFATAKSPNNKSVFVVF